ncbi:Nre family DNA repair protein [Methanococcoides sp. NM1]|uniref:Nre family DNA repair protein n=1 Tax=Methanococcoides sp. NM1 TaxID=1201013 RepID=UPI0010848E48|nr:Nre family DNA repair protein [Methanococcoides sp. NM1]
MSKSLCIKCKGKGLCGRPLCPILEKFRSTENTTAAISTDGSIFGASPPAVFVGRYGYPQVTAGPMIPPQVDAKDAMMLEDPKQWLSMDIQDVISARCQLVRANTTINVKDAMKTHKLLEKSQELALSRSPVDTEAWFTKPLQQKLKFDSVLTPMGPSGAVKDFDIAENPKVPKKVDYLAYDTDALAKDVVCELFRSDIPTEHITRLLSIGLLGQQRKLVPTRWAITATDDMAGKDIIDHVRDMPLVSEISVFSGGCFGNYFEIMLVPRVFSFELLEIWMKRSVWTGGSSWIGQDMEDINGKKGYSNLAGGYYAARIAALEYLEDAGRQASVFMIREITPEYWAPLGVWVVREAARYAMSSIPRTFETIEEALDDMATRVRTPAQEWKAKTKMLSDVRFQRTLDSFL